MPDGNMTALLTKILTNKPRETAGARTSSRYEFQANVAILKIIDLHEEDRDYRAVFDLFDDLMILDRSSDATRAQFYQIKSKANGRWTIKAVAKVDDGADPPRSIVGKMYQNVTIFAETAESINFVSNAAFKFKLADSTNTSDDHLYVKGGVLHEEEYAHIDAALDADFPQPRSLDYKGLLIFERTSLGIRDQGHFVKGRLVDYFDKFAENNNVPVKAIYNVLFRNVVEKTGITQDFSSLEEIYEKKSLCRAEVEALLERPLWKPRFLDGWPMIEAELTTTGANSREKIQTKTACIRYILQRISGNQTACQFSEVVRSAAAGMTNEIATCPNILDIADMLAVSEVIDDAPYQGIDLRGALIVEAFFEMKDE